MLTKADRIPPDEESEWLHRINPAADTAVPWFFVKNPGTKEINAGMTWEDARSAEREYFATKAPWATLEWLQRQRLGCERLTERLSENLSVLISHRSVLGYMILSRSQPVTIIRHSGVVFEGEQGKKYAGVVSRIVQSVQEGLEEVSGERNDGVSTESEPASASRVPHSAVVMFGLC